MLGTKGYIAYNSHLAETKVVVSCIKKLPCMSHVRMLSAIASYVHEFTAVTNSRRGVLSHPCIINQIVPFLRMDFFPLDVNEKSSFGHAFMTMLA